MDPVTPDGYLGMEPPLGEEEGSGDEAHDWDPSYLVHFLSRDPAIGHLLSQWTPNIIICSPRRRPPTVLIPPKSGSTLSSWLFALGVNQGILEIYSLDIVICSWNIFN